VRLGAFAVLEERIERRQLLEGPSAIDDAVSRQRYQWLETSPAVSMPLAYEALSDHCPVVAQIEDADQN